MTRYLMLIVLALAAALRLTFVLPLDRPPLYWDEVHYHGWAGRYADAWRSAVREHDLAPLRGAYVSSMQKGEVYSAAVGLLYAIVGSRPKAMFAAQAVLDTATCFVIARIAWQLGGPGAGLLALVFAAFYEPFVFAAARLQTETLCVFLASASLWAFIAQPRRGVVVARMAAGVLLALAMLTRPALQYLFPLLLPLAAITARDAPLGRRAVMMGAFAAGFFLLIGPRLLVTSQILGTPLWSGTLDPSADMYAGVVIDNAGWKTDRLAFAHPPRDELLEVMRERGADEDPDASPTLDEFHRAVFRTWQSRPLESARVFSHKLYQAWLQPYNDSLQRVLTGPGGQRLIHQVILVLGMLGIGMALWRWREGLPLVVTALYLWVTYLVVKIEVRYVVTVMPLMICFAAQALDSLARGVAARWRTRTVVVFAALAAALVVMLQVCSLGRLLELMPGLSPAGAHLGRVVTSVIVMVVIAALAAEVLAASVPRRQALLTVVAPLGVAAIVFLVGRPVGALWHEWTCTLTAGGGVIRHEFVLPSDLPTPQLAQLRLDLDGDELGGADLIVTVNGHEARSFAGGPKRDDAVPPEDNYEGYYNEIFAGQRRPQRPWHAWYAAPIPIESVTPSATIRVEARIEGPADVAGAVRVFGDYATNDERSYDGPSPYSPAFLGHTSFYKYIVDGDFRLRWQVPLSGEAHGSFNHGRGWSSDDLSLEPGRQSGRYRILLVVVDQDGDVLIF